MKFTESYTFTRSLNGQDKLITIDPCLLDIWWSAFDGPQTAEGIVAAHLSTIDEMIRLKAQENWASVACEHITLMGMDYEDDEPFDEVDGLTLQDMLRSI